MSLWLAIAFTLLCLAGLVVVGFVRAKPLDDSPDGLTEADDIYLAQMVIRAGRDSDITSKKD